MTADITAYDITIRVRDAGEKTFAEGTVRLDGEWVPFRAEAGATDRATLYTLGERRFWWNEAPEIDEWFEDRWQEAAAKYWNAEFGEPDDFVEHMMSKEEQNDA